MRTDKKSAQRTKQNNDAGAILASTDAVRSRCLQVHERCHNLRQRHKVRLETEPDATKAKNNNPK